MPATVELSRLYDNVQFCLFVAELPDRLQSWIHGTYWRWHPGLDDVCTRANGVQQAANCVHEGWQGMIRAQHSL